MWSGIPISFRIFYNITNNPVPQDSVAQKVKISCNGFIVPIFFFLDIPTI